jgi:hypothetical protein
MTYCITRGPITGLIAVALSIRPRLIQVVPGTETIQYKIQGLRKSDVIISVIAYDYVPKVFVGYAKAVDTNSIDITFVNIDNIPSLPAETYIVIIGRYTGPQLPRSHI